jgi:hypothetical protein
MSPLIMTARRTAIDCQACAGDVGRLRTGDERHHHRDIIDAAVAIERGVGLLRGGPISGRRDSNRYLSDRLGCC